MSIAICAPFCLATNGYTHTHENKKKLNINVYKICGKKSVLTIDIVLVLIVDRKCIWSVAPIVWHKLTCYILHYESPKYDYSGVYFPYLYNKVYCILYIPWLRHGFTVFFSLFRYCCSFASILSFTTKFSLNAWWFLFFILFIAVQFAFPIFPFVPYIRSFCFAHLPPMPPVDKDCLLM